MHVSLHILKEMGLLEHGKSIPTGHAPREQEHGVSMHNRVWAYCKENLSGALGGGRRKLFMDVDQNTPWDEIVANSRLGVFIGAAASSSMRRYVDHRDCLSLVFEPDLAVLADFASGHKPHYFAAGQCYMFGGSIHTLKAPLSHLLPKSVFDLGFPVIYIQNGLKELVASYVDHVVETLEFLYYRYNIYPVRSTLYSRSRPLRNIKSELYFDQQMHFYVNVPRFLQGINIGRLKDRLKGATVLAALAGPSLEQRMDYIKREREKSLLICANSALPVLLEHGVEPDIAVISDTTELSGACLTALKAPLKTILVGHCLAQLNTDAFSRQCIYGNWREDVFGKRGNLLTHGSVLTTMYALAKLIGGARLVLVGAILAGTSPQRPLAYAVGAPQGTVSAEGRHAPLTHKYPELYPALNSRGETMFTTLNFRDVSLWLLDEIRMNPLEVVNTAPESIFWGPGVRIDEDYSVPRSFLIHDVMEALRAEAPDNVDVSAVAALLVEETRFWEEVAGMATAALSALDQEELKPAMSAVKQFDESNVTFLVHRFEDFNNAKFTAKVFTGKKPAMQLQGLQYYMDYVRRMAGVFLDTLQQTTTRVRTMQ